jgi:hypothetical protein
LRNDVRDLAMQAEQLGPRKEPLSGPIRKVNLIGVHWAIIGASPAQAGYLKTVTRYRRTSPFTAAIDAAKSAADATIVTPRMTL